MTNKNQKKIYVEGNTYPYRAHFQAHGFTYEPNAKRWSKPVTADQWPRLMAPETRQAVIKELAANVRETQAFIDLGKEYLVLSRSNTGPKVDMRNHCLGWIYFLASDDSEDDYVEDFF